MFGFNRKSNNEIPVGFMGITEDNFDRTPGMERLNYKMKLMRDCLKMFDDISQKKLALSSSVLRLMKSNVKKDLKQGLKVISRKIPIYVELPKHTEVGNGEVKKVYDVEDLNKDEEVEVTTPVVSKTRTIRKSN